MKKLVYNIVCMILLVLGIFFAYDSFYIIYNNKIRMFSPDLVNKSYEESKEIAELLNLNLEIISKAHTDYPKDYVYLQIPEANKPIKNSRTLKIALSLGPFQMKLKNFLGLELEDAKTEIQKIGLTLITVSYVWNEAPFNTVIGTYPLDNKVLYEQKEISLLVSSGQKNKLVLVPSLIGFDYEKARELLNENELIMADPRYVDSNKVPKNSVISQSIHEGKYILSGSYIDLTISK